MSKSYVDIIKLDSPASIYMCNDSGTIAVDLMAVQNGVYNGGYTQLQTGIIPHDSAKSTLFGGVSGDISIASNANQQPNSASFSVEAWFNTVAYEVTNAGAGIFIKDKGTLGNGIWNLGQSATGVTSFLMTSSINNPISATAAISSLGVTYHIVGVYDVVANTVTCYLNAVPGTPVSTAGNAFTTQNSTCWIGQQKSGNNRWFNGTIQGCAIYHSALTQNQITTHYQAGIRTLATTRTAASTRTSASTRTAASARTIF